MVIQQFTILYIIQQLTTSTVLLTWRET